MTNPLVADVLEQNDFLRGQNANYRSFCQDIADFCLPRKAWQTSIRSKGERTKFNFLYDSTAIRGLRTTTSGFHTHLTNPTGRWFMLESQDRRHMQRRDVQTYFKQVEDVIFTTLATSNFYNTIQEFYTEFIAFGTSTFLIQPDDAELVRFNQIPVSQIARVTDGHDRVVGIYREFKLTARQAFRLWGTDAGQSVLKALEKRPHEEFDFVHFVGERAIRQAGKMDQANMPFQSVWVAKKDKSLIAKGGFQEMPYISEVFYRDSYDPNGFSPTMDVLAEIKLVNAMMRTIIRGGMKQADPPLVLPNAGFILPLNLNPAALNYREAKGTAKDDLQALPVGQGRIDISVELLQMVQSKIEEGMFVPLFRALDQITKQMTIPEVQRRIAENMGLLGPVVGRVNNGVLEPTIIRVFNILRDQLMLPEPPEILRGTRFIPVYLSPLARAQRQSEITEIQSFLAEVQAVAAIAPQAIHNVDEDKVIQVLSRIRGITPEIMRSDEDIERMRKLEAEQQQLMTGMSVVDAATQIAKTGSEAARNDAQAQTAGAR